MESLDPVLPCDLQAPPMPKDEAREEARAWAPGEVRVEMAVVENSERGTH